MAIQKNPTQGKKGMERDKAAFDLGETEYSFALNVNFHDEHGSGQVNLQNEPSNVYCTGFKEGYKVIGHKYDVLSENTYFFLTNPTTGCSEIGYIKAIRSAESLEQVEQECNCELSVILENPLENTIQQAMCSYFTIVEDSCLGECNGCLKFDINHPIHEKNVLIKREKTGAVLYFTDFKNPQRYIQLDYLERYRQNIDDCTGEVVTTCLQCDKMRVFPLYDKPCLTVVDMQNGGTLKAGNYEVLIAYSSQRGDSLTSPYSITNPTPIFDPNNKVLDQTLLDYQTNYAIKIAIGDIDKSYDYFKIFVIYRSGLDSSVSVYDYNTYPIDTKNITIGSLQNKANLKIGLEELLALRPFYTKAKGIADINGYMWQYGLETHREINLQKIVNLLGGHVKWSTVLASEDLYEDGASVANYTSYMRDEVVPASIKFFLEGGHETALFPFIARPPKPSEIEELGIGYPSDINTQSVLKYNKPCDGNLRNKRWQFENTAEKIGRCSIPTTSGYEEQIIVKEVVSKCTVEDEDGNILEVAETGPGSFSTLMPSGILNYINNNSDAIIVSTDLQFQDIKEILLGEYAGTCTPEFGTNCKTEIETVSKVIAYRVEGEENTEESIPYAEYERIHTPSSQNCAAVNTIPTTEGGATGPQNDVLFQSTYMRPFETVYQRNGASTNISCSTAMAATQFTNGVTIDSSFFLQYGGTLGPKTALQSTTSTTNIQLPEFTNKIHTNAIWYKIEFNGQEELALEFSANTCDTNDDIVDNRLRVSFYKDCPAITEVPLYNNIIEDTTLSNDINKFYVLQASDFGGINSTVYFAVDSPINTDVELELLLTGSSGDYNIEIDGTNYNIPYSTSIPNTVSNFVTANAALLLSSKNIVATNIGSAIRFRMTEEQYLTVNYTSGASDLGGIETIIEKYNVLSPTCGCTNVFMRSVEVESVVKYDKIFFAKQITSTKNCEYTVPIANNCDPIPYEYGTFSYWESTEKYPCNGELYDSSDLIISQTDIPNNYQDEFEDNYASGISGGNYILNSETDFRDKSIRHYKFPCSIKVPFMSTNLQEPGDFNKGVIYPIGFSIDNEIISAFLDIAVKNNLLTLNERLRITKYEIFRGDRSTDKSIIAKGLLFNMREYNEGNGDLVLYPNYPLNPMGNDLFNSNPKVPVNNSFTFHSPETSFLKPTLPNELKIEGFQFGKSANYFDEVRNHPTMVVLGPRAYKLATGLATAEITLEILLSSLQATMAATSAGTPYGIVLSIVIAVGIVLAVVGGLFKIGRLRYQWLETFENIGQPKQFGYYKVAVGHYNYFLPNTTSPQTTRGLAISQYIKDGRISVQNEYEPSTPNININNTDREHAVMLHTQGFPINGPSVFTNWENGTNTTVFGYSGTGRSGRIVKNAAAPYGALKQYLPAQYGNIQSILWINTGYCGDLNERKGCDPIFGGDTFISRFALKKKFPYFTSNAFGLAPLTPYKYSDYFNIYPTSNIFRYYIDYKFDDSTESFGAFVFPDNKSVYNLDFNLDPNGFYIKPPAKFYLYSYGFPYFLVESVINCNYRYAKREIHEDFYPNFGDVIENTQEEKISIREPNTYFYNFVYSAVHTKVPYRLLPFDYNQEKYARLAKLQNTTIYSQQDNSENSLVDPWLMYRPLDSYNFPTSNGKLIDIQALESEQAIARFENGLSILGTVDVLKERVQPGTATLGSGGIFAGRTANFNKTELGYAGTQNKAMVNCEFGHFWVDAKRGKVFNVGPNGKDFSEITGGVSKWFKENLPFKILKSIPNADIDNAYNGAGITMGWDDRLKRVFLTKKDFIPKREGINYSENIGYYLQTGELQTCPEGYIDYGDYCEYTEIVPKILAATPISVVDSTSSAYGWESPLLFSSFNMDGSGLVDVLSPTGFTFEKLLDNYWIGSGTVLNSLVNRLGKWLSVTINNVWYGATSLLELATTKTYHVVLAGDNRFRLSIDGVVIITSDQNTLNAQIGSGPVDQTLFNRCFIYPVELNAGCHTIKIEGLNFGSQGMFAGAILDNTALEIATATLDSDLNFVYTTETETAFYEDGIEYSCPEGFEELGPGFCDDCKSVTRYEKEDPFETVELYDKEYFEECSWTIAYSPLTKTWISYYSFLPNYFIAYNDYFQTGINYPQEGSQIGLWSHLSFLSSYQVFYGTLYPFTIETPVKSKMMDSVLQSVEYWLESRKYFDKYNSTDAVGKGFNKAWIYNNYQNSGLLNLISQEINNMHQSMLYPKHNSDSTSILQTEINGKWTFNYFYNIIKKENSGLPIWKYDCSQIDKILDDRLLDYRNSYKDKLRGDHFLLRLSQDIESRFKMIYRFSITKQDYYEG